MPQRKAMDKIYGMYRVLERTPEVQDEHRFTDIRGFSENAKSTVLYKHHKLSESFKSGRPQLFQKSRPQLKILGVRKFTNSKAQRPIPRAHKYLASP
jgi:hypothetical protein